MGIRPLLANIRPSSGSWQYLVCNYIIKYHCGSIIIQTKDQICPPSGECLPPLIGQIHCPSISGWSHHIVISLTYLGFIITIPQPVSDDAMFDLVIHIKEHKVNN